MTGPVGVYSIHRPERNLLTRLSNLWLCGGWCAFADAEAFMCMLIYDVVRAVDTKSRVRDEGWIITLSRFRATFLASAGPHG